MCAQLCPTQSDLMDSSLLGSSVHDIFLARILEWVAISSFRGSSLEGRYTWVIHGVSRTLYQQKHCQLCPRGTESV